MKKYLRCKLIEEYKKERNNSHFLFFKICRIIERVACIELLADFYFIFLFQNKIFKYYILNIIFEIQILNINFFFYIRVCSICTTEMSESANFFRWQSSAMNKRKHRDSRPIILPLPAICITSGNRVYT